MKNKKKIIIIISIVIVAVIFTLIIPVRNEYRIEPTPVRVFKYKDYYNIYGIKIYTEPIKDEVTELM